MHPPKLTAIHAQTRKNRTEEVLVSMEVTVVFPTFTLGRLNPLKTSVQLSMIPANVTMIVPTASIPACATLTHNVWNTIPMNEKKNLQTC